MSIRHAQTEKLILNEDLLEMENSEDRQQAKKVGEGPLDAAVRLAALAE